MSLVINSLFIYPLKSCAPLKVTEINVDASGLSFDRRWMLLREGRMLTQRTNPIIGQLKVYPSPGGCRMEFDGRDPLVVDEVAFLPAGKGIKVWSRNEECLEAPESYNRWLRESLGLDVQLVMKSREDHQIRDETTVGSLVDSAPVLVCASASIEELRQSSGIEEDLALRFRPNLMVETQIPFEEELWQRIFIDNVVLERVKACVRCVMITLDPFTVEPHPKKEPLSTLLKLHHDEKKRPIFGVYFRVKKGGILRQGSEVEVISMRSNDFQN